ncbi:5-hydroxytryptamine receptor 3A-like [Synchiropus splendidus]|uniref:5-hydroxytryptamine receptor 3A-like n=1 Tax=Synchiropus splendidus TaxID=270530 RepID=UPI00237E1249|nr:5-hydroxytryptamine receptor 3A-like [Synchiropus splendidus]
MPVSGSAKKTCSYQDVLNHLSLTRSNDLFTMTRPVKDYTTPTKVYLEVLLYAILDVREIDQTFISYVWMFMTWKNEYISWNETEFCGIQSVAIPTGILWKPDITIDEMTEKDKAPSSPHLVIYYNGLVQEQNNQVLTSTCRMHIYKFPFDVQSCELSFKSVVHATEEIELHHVLSSTGATEWTRNLMQSQYEWLFINMTVINKTVQIFNYDQDYIVYTINMRRRSILYTVNFLLPILFFFCLDLASFLISDVGGEKLGFKITVLLAVTVMQLILNEILPSSSNSVPLIAVYCIGMFTLMMLSLLETILVMYLIQKDSEPEKQDTEKKQGKKWDSFCISDRSTDGTSSEAMKASDSQQRESQSVERLSGDIKELTQALTQLINSKTEADKPGYWSRMTVTINRVFCVFYVTAVSVFLVFMFIQWQY